MLPILLPTGAGLTNVPNTLSALLAVKIDSQHRSQYWSLPLVFLISAASISGMNAAVMCGQGGPSGAVMDMGLSWDRSGTEGFHDGSAG